MWQFTKQTSYVYLYYDYVSLDSSFPVNDEHLVIQGYNLVRWDHRSNPSVEEFAFTTKTLYRWNSFAKKNLELNLDKATTFNPFLVIVIDDSNAKLCNWCIIDKINLEGAKIDTLISQNGLHQIIKEPTHILDTSSSCIGLFFTSQPKLVMGSGVHASLHVNCHHQIIYAKFNLQRYYPPPYERVIWHYKLQIRIISEKLYAHCVKSVQIFGHISHSGGFDYERSFVNKDVNEMVNILNENIFHVLKNCISHETIFCDDQIPHELITKSKKRCKEKISF